MQRKYVPARQQSSCNKYTALPDVTGSEPPTYNCVGISDGIADYHSIEKRIGQIRSNKIDAEIEVFEGLPHGFGLGTGIVAEGWLDNAVAFGKNRCRDKR